ncbi:ribonuclease HII [Paenibacillus sp. MY03]|jgi:ribonuclease HII|uniref:Ribonuclease HII n=1 Tax=Paenibacillus agaridevorans TaxID=171404 RepID=A0A2R5F1H5_9BACL|nr:MULTISPECIES: ribonuclease HII [Paenibacillus]OUS68006.1 ribonuclease HII [Paenibacillus sp. MY03]GBG09574.1 ribonuclease HII [Paenibacillus agaridevorans]
MLQYEQQAWGSGFSAIAGVDEVGRGCLFGDVVAGAVILPQGLIIDGVDDSKKLSEKKREQLYDVIAEQSIAWSVARVDAASIDRLNIKQASRLAMKLAVETLAVPADYLLVDAEIVDLSLPQESIVKGDANSQSIAAASIMAKVTRDRLCLSEWETLYPQYGIAIHKGYATKLHREKLLQYGPCELHRRTFLKKLLGEDILQTAL